MTTAKKTTSTAPAGATSTKAMLDAGFGAMPDFGTDWLKSMTEMGNQMLTFTAARIKRDLEMQQALLQAKGLAEVQQIQTQFFQQAMQDYTTEMTKLMEMGTSAESVSHKHESMPV